MSFVVFTCTVTAEILTLTSVIISIAIPRHRLWPPHHEHTWGGPVMLILFLLSASGAFILGILDWSQFILPVWIRSGFGLPLWFLGMGLGIWSMTVLGLAQSSGNARGLIRNGPYRFSRNPQYIGFILGLAGWSVMANSA